MRFTIALGLALLSIPLATADLVAVAPDGDAEATLVAVALDGDASGVVAVAPQGDARGDVTVSGMGDADTFDGASGGVAAVSALGNAHATFLALSATGNATTIAGPAVAGTGDADACHPPDLYWGEIPACVAVSGTGNASGFSALSLFGTARSSSFLALSGTGDAGANEWGPPLVAASGTGDAHGTIAVGGCRTLVALGEGGACDEPGAPVLP